MAEEIIKFRPHHFMCTLGFQGHGYSLGFVKNYRKITAQLKANEDSLIEVTGGLDSICSACPNKLARGLCKTQSKIEALDSMHSEILGIPPKEVLSWREGKRKIRKHMTIERFHTACAPCSWKKYGICQTALETLVNN